MATGNTLITINPLEAEFPAANFPQHDLRNAHPVLDFDAATAETCYFTRTLPKLYAGGGLTVRIRWAASTATSGNCKWNVQIERIDAGTLDIDADSFASAQTTTTAANGTSGITVETVITFTSGAQMDSVAAGETFRLLLQRDAANGGDTMTGDAELVALIVEET